MGKIRFRVNYQIKQKRKFEEFLDRYQTEIGLKFIELKIERYWKIEEQFQATFLIQTDSTSNEKRVYETLTMANQLWSTDSLKWIINGPHEDESLIFECIFNNDNDDQPLKWAHLELENE